jgi:hypothetical protein
MMKYAVRLLLHILLLMFFFQSTYGQTSQLYLHTDRDYYLPGDTVWFKGYFIKDGAIARDLHNMYMKLIDEGGKEIWQSVALIKDGVTASYFTIPAGYPGQEIFINANTLLDSCVNSRPYFKKLGILQLSHENPTSTIEKVPEFKLVQQPEGGILLSGLENTLLIQTLDSRGYPAFVKGKMVDEKAGDITEFRTDSAGFATLRTIFEPDRSYMLQWADPLGILHKDKIQPVVQGAKVALVKQDSLVLVQLQTNLPSQLVHVTVGIGKRALFDQEFNLKEGKKTNIPLKKADLEYGILQAVVRDKQQVVSRTSLLVDDEQIEVSPIVSVSSTFQEKSEGTVTVTLPKGEKMARLSVSVVDAEVAVDTTQSMLTDIYFQPLSQQPLVNPQLLWERTENKNLFIQGQTWDDSYCPSSELTVVDPPIKIQGQIRLKKGSWAKFYSDYLDEVNKGKKRNLPARGISFGYQYPETPRMQYTELMFDKNGNFAVPNSIIFDSLETRVIQIYRKLKFTPFTVQYKFADPKNYRYPILIPVQAANASRRELNNLKGLHSDYFTMDAHGNRVLQTVQVTRTRRQREIDRLQFRFRTIEPQTVHQPDLILLPLMDSSVIRMSQSLREYIATKVPAQSVSIILNGKLAGGTGDVAKAAADGSGLSNVVKKTKTDPDKLEELNRQYQLSFLDEDVSNYPYLKFYRTYSSPVYSGTNVLLVFEYSPAEVNRDLGSDEYHETIAGYMPLKAYTNKVYSSTALRLSSGLDTRLTLYWDPFFDFNQAEQSKEFVFYNNSRNKGVWVTIQGLTETGKVVYYRRMIKNNKK